MYKLLDKIYCNFYNIYVSYAKIDILLMSISLMSFSEIIKSDENKSGMQVDCLYNQKRKPSKQKCNW